MRLMTAGEFSWNLVRILLQVFGFVREKEKGSYWS